MTKKTFAISLMVALVSGISFADTAVSVVDHSGGKNSFEKSKIKTIHLKSSTIEIEDQTGKISSFGKADIDYILLSDDAAGIEMIKEDGSPLNVSLNKGSINVDNAEGMEWILSDLSGKIIAKGKIMEPNAIISIEHLPSEIYIFSIGTKNLKIVKR